MRFIRGMNTLGRKYTRALRAGRAVLLAVVLCAGSFTACAVDEKDYGNANLFVDGLRVHPFALFTLLDPYPALKSGFVKMKPAAQ